MDTVDQQNNREKRVERGLIVAALVALLLSTYLIWNEALFNRLFGEKNQGKAIAKITSAKNDIRRRNTDQMAWYSLDTDQEIYQEDLIFAGNDSEAVIEFEGGNKLKIDPNSLIALKQKDGALELSLEYGAFKGQVQRGKDFEITINGKKQVIRGGEDADFVIKKGDGGTEIEVISGEIQVGDQKIAKDQKVAVGDDGLVSLPSGAEINLVTPQFAASVWIQANGETNFNWTPITSRQYEISIAKDANFKNLVLKQKVSNQENYNASLSEEGSYFWKVTSVGTVPIVTSQTRSFTARLETSPELVFPSPLAEYTVDPIRNEENNTLEWPQKTITFEFNHQPLAKTYEVQISDSEDFSTNVIRRNTTPPRLENIPLPSGQYFWRVRVADLGRDKAVWSTTGEFRIYNDQQPLDAPTLLLAEAMDYEIPALQYPDWLYSSPNAIVSEFLIQELPQRSFVLPSFSFNNVFAAQSYEYEIRSLQEGTTRTIRSSEPKSNLKSLIPGRYTVRARATNEATKPSAWSQPINARVSVTPPASAVPVTFVGVTNEIIDKVETVNLKWSRRLFARAYEVQLSRSANFNDSKSFVQNSTSLNIEVFPNKDYYWRVRALNSAQNAISRFSQIFRLRYNQDYVPPTQIIAENEEIPEAEFVPVLQKPKSSAELGAEGLLARNRAPRFFSWEVERRDPRKKPDYWVKAGTGFGYQSASSSSGSQTVDLDQLGGPTAFINVGATLESLGLAGLGFDFKYEQRPGEVSPTNGTTVTPSTYSWQKLAMEGVVALKGLMKWFGLDTETRIRAGFEQDQMPLVADNGTTNLDLATATINSATLGADFTLGRVNRLRYELFTKFNYPLSGETDLGSSFTISPSFSFDGGIGLTYRLTPTSYIGLNWGAEFQSYSFELQNGSTIADGDRTLFNTNIDTQIGFEF